MPARVAAGLGGRAGAGVLGAADRDDGAERGAMVRGRRFDLDGGKRVLVLGVLEVRDHPAAWVNNVLVGAWVEIRVTGG